MTPQKMTMMKIMSRMMVRIMSRKLNKRMKTGNFSAIVIPPQTINYSKSLQPTVDTAIMIKKRSSWNNSKKILPMKAMVINNCK